MTELRIYLSCSLNDGSKIFLTSGTGYIGGSVLDDLVKQHPEYDITVLLRNPLQQFAQQFPKVKFVRGDYDSADLLESAAAEADVVVHNGSSVHGPSLRAIVHGLVKTGQQKFLFDLSGTGIIADWGNPTYIGRLNPKVWSDIHDIEEITSRPDGELHRYTDRFLQESARAHGEKLKIATMCPPNIYGQGSGPGRTQSVYIASFYDEIKKIGAPCYCGAGLNTRSCVHVDDLVQLYGKLVEAAVAGGRSAYWGVEVHTPALLVSVPNANDL